ncbi:hypothetical protein ACFQE1_12070 [Halobium palmae]|uniref:Transposase n=1 Tax=Halobium palmae TaxID=1776492 RepID=A0ABD5S0K5_9EURY
MTSGSESVYDRFEWVVAELPLPLSPRLRVGTVEQFPSYSS